MLSAHEPLGSGLWRLPLPSRTPPPYDHTNTYLVGDGAETVLVDAGFGDPAVLDVLGATFEAHTLGKPKALLLTHTHPDHCLGAGALRKRYGLTVYAHPLELPHLSVPAEPLGDGASLTVGAETLSAHHTPGHSPGSLSFALQEARVLLVGDLLTAEGSSFVGLPDGDVTDYLASLERLERLVEALGVRTLAPGHGPLVRDPRTRLNAVRAHRLGREAEVVAALATGAATVADLRRRSYPELPEPLAALAEGSLGAHLQKLVREGRVREDRSGAEIRWTAVEPLGR